MNENATRAAAKELGWEITRESMKPCEACCVGKANKKNFSNNSDHKKSKGNDERTYIDISSVKVNKGGPLAQSKLHWLIMVDELTNLKFTKFFSTRNGIIEKTLEQI